jgi:hypothetical protein
MGAFIGASVWACSSSTPTGYGDGSSNNGSGSNSTNSTHGTNTGYGTNTNNTSNGNTGANTTSVGNNTTTTAGGGTTTAATTVVGSSSSTCGSCSAAAATGGLALATGCKQSTVGTGGYAYPYGDYKDMSGAPTSCASTSCISDASLCAAGTTVPAGATYACYGTGFGLETGGVAIGATGISFTLSGTLPTGGGQVVLVTAAGSYCALFTATGAQTIDYTKFNTKCYDSPPDGTALPAGATVTKVNFQVSSSSTASQTWALCLSALSL